MRQYKEKHRMDPKVGSLLGPMLERQTPRLSRRRLVIRTLLPSFLAACLAFSPLAAQEAPWRHGSALLDEPKYPQGFPHFDYVNPNAPKGGLVRLGALGTFDSFNVVVAGVKGSPEQGLGLIYETLTASALDEPSASYGLLAESFTYPEDYSSVSFRLRPEARWHDGRPVTVDDVIFSFEALKTNSPTYAFYYANVTKAEKTGEREVKFTFDEKGNRELPQIMGQLMVLPKHWWEGTASDGRKRDITQTTLEPPLGSGPYRLKNFDAGRNASYERVKDYWGETDQRECRAEQFRRDPLRILSRRDGAARSLQGGPSRFPHREQRPQLGDGIRLPGPAGRPRGARRVFLPRHRRDAGLRAQHAARQVQGPARPPRLQPRLPLRGAEQDDLLRPLRAPLELFLRPRPRLLGTARRTRARDPRIHPRQGSGIGLHDALTRTRSTIRPRRSATTCARPTACSRKPAGR